MKLKNMTSLITDYVANGSFQSLRENAYYVDKPKAYARVIRLTDYNNNYSETDCVWVDEKGYNFLKKSSLIPDDIIISNVGAYLGSVFLAPKLTIPMTLGPNAILIRPNQLVLNKYLYYLLISEYGHQKILSIKSGSAMPKFNKTELKELDFTIHELNVQQHIVDSIKKEGENAA
jgi:type I restriction enzyme S subunit